MLTQHRDNNCVVADDKNKPEIITYTTTTQRVELTFLTNWSVRIRANVRQLVGPWRSFSISWTLLRTTHWCCGLR